MKENYEKDIIDLNNHDSNSTDENHMYEGIIKDLLMKQKAITVNFISKILLFVSQSTKIPPRN
jgi:hypothetical protein